MAAYDALDLATALIDQPAPIFNGFGNLAESQPTPPPLRSWPRGERVSELEARLRAKSALALPLWEDAAADGALSALWNTGWLLKERDDHGAITYARAKDDPLPVAAKGTDAPQTKFVDFGHTAVRTLHVQTVEGVQVPIRVTYPVAPYDGPREGYAAHVEKAIAEGTPNPI